MTLENSGAHRHDDLKAALPSGEGGLVRLFLVTFSPWLNCAYPACATSRRIGSPAYHLGAVQRSLLRPAERTIAHGPRGCLQLRRDSANPGCWSPDTIAPHPPRQCDAMHAQILCGASDAPTVLFQEGY